MFVRDFSFGDEPALHTVFYSAIHTIAVRDYTPEQLKAWAPDPPDVVRWTARMRAIRPFVVEDERRIVGYADLQANGYIDHFFCFRDMRAPWNRTHSHESDPCPRR